MSGQNAKKKRLGSRRAVSRPKETSETDELHRTDSDSAARHHAEERTESTGVMPELDEFRFESKQPIPMSRRKLGSSRKHKGKQHGKDSDIDTHPEVEEEVEESTRGLNTTEPTQTLEALQLECQEEICEGSKQAISAPLKTSPAICPEEATESLSPKNENKPPSFQNEEMTESPHVDGTFQLMSQSVLSRPLLDEQLVSISPSDCMGRSDQGLSHLNSIEETEGNKTSYTDLFTKSRDSQGTSLISDLFEQSIVSESETLDEKSSAGEITEVKHSLEQPLLSSLKHEVVANEEQNEHVNTFAVRYAQQPEEIVSRLNDETQYMYQKEDFPQSQMLHPSDDACSGQAEITSIPNPQCSKQGQQIRESYDEVPEHIFDDGNTKTVISFTTEEKKEELCEGGKHSLSEPNYSSMFFESETGFQLSVSDKSLEDTLKRQNESDALENEEVKGYLYSVGDVKQKLKEEVEPTQTEEATPMFNTSARVLNDAADTDGSEMISEPVKPHTTKIVYTYDMIVKSADGSATDKEDSSLDWKQDENQGEQCHIDESKSVETGFNQSDNGNTLTSIGSDEGRQQIKETEVELPDDADSGETSETITMPLTETKKELSLFKEYDSVLSVSHDRPSFSVSTIGYSSEVQSSLESEVPKYMNIQDQDMRETGLKIEVLDKLEKLDNLDSSDPLENEEVKDARLSRDDGKKVSEDKVNPAQETSYLFLHETTDPNDSEIFFENPTDLTEIPKPHQSVLSRKNSHDSATHQQNVCSDTDPVQESLSKEILLTLERKGEDYFADDSKQPGINHSDMGDIALGRDDEDSDVKHSADIIKSDFSFQTSPSHQNISFDSQHQDSSPSVNEQTDTDIDPRGKRRKLGSSRRIKGRQQVVKTPLEVAENTKEPDTPEIMTVPLTPESRPDLVQQSEPDIMLSASHSSSVITVSKPDYSSELQNTPVANYSETDLQSFIPHSEYLQGDLDDTFTGGVITEGLLNKLEEATMEDCNKSHIEDVKLVHNTAERMLDVADENSEIISVNLKEPEIKSTTQYEVTVESLSDSAATQKYSRPDVPQVEHCTEGSNLEPSEQKNKSDHLHPAEKSRISDMERQHMSPDCADVEKGGVNDEEIFHWEKEESYDKASERANAKTAAKEPNGATELLPIQQTKSWITSVETIMEGTEKSDPSQTEEEILGRVVCTSELTTANLFANPSEDEQEIDQSECRQMLHDEYSSIVSVEDEGTGKCTELLKQEGNFQNYSVNEPCVGPMTVMTSTENRRHEEQTESKQNVTFEVDMPANTREEQLLHANRHQHSKDAGSQVDEPCIEPVQKQEVAQVFCESVIKQNYTRDICQPELDIRSMDDSPIKSTFSDPDNQQVLSEQNTFEAINHQHESDTNEADDIEKGDMLLCAEKTPYQDNKGPPQQNNTDPSPDVNLGLVSQSQDGLIVTLLEGMEKTGMAESEDVNLDAEQKAHFSSVAPLSECTNLTVDRQLIKSNISEVPDEEFPACYSVSANKETDEDTQMLKLAERFLGDDSFMDVDSEYRQSAMTAGICSDKSNPEHEVQCSAEQQTFPSPKEETVENREPKEQSSSSEDRDIKLQTDHTDATQIQVVHHISLSSALEDKPPLQTLETNICLDSQLQDTCQSINDELHTDIKPAGNKRRLGSSRRSKGRHQVKEEASEPHPETKEDHVEATNVDESLKITKMLLATETIIQEESDHLKFAEDVTKYSLTESENIEKLPEEDLFFTQNVMSNRASETTDFISISDNASLKSNVDIEKNDKTLVEEPIRGVTGSDIDFMNSFQTAHVPVWRGESDLQNISSHGDNSSSTSTTKDVVDQIEASQIQNAEVLTCDNDSLRYKIDVRETEKCCEMAESWTDGQGLEQSEAGRKCEDPANEANAAQGIYTSPQLVSAAQVTAVDVSFSGGFSTTMDAADNRESEISNPEYCETLQVKSKQKRRKLGSTRRGQLSGKQEKDKVLDGTDTDSDVRNVVKLEVVEQLQICAEVSENENASPASSPTHKELQETNNPPSAPGVEHEHRGSTPDVQSTDSNMIPDINDLLDLLPQQSASHNVSIVNPVNDADVRVEEIDVNVTVPPPQIHSFTNTEIQITSERNRQQTENTDNTGVARESLMLASETTEVTHSEEKPKSVDGTQDQKDDQQNPNDEELESKNFIVKTTTNRRRKLGSSRRNLGLQAKGEALRQEQEEDHEARGSQTPDRDVTAITVSGFEEQELQLHPADGDHQSEQEEENILETVECTPTIESQLQPPAQETAPQSQPVETEHQSSDSGCSPSASDTMSELASGGRRRKLGSHRKSHGHQNQKDQSSGGIDARDERHVSSIAEAHENTATEEQRKEPSSRDKISKVDERQKKPSASFSDPSRLVSGKTPSQPHHAYITLNQESQTQLSSVGNPRGREAKSNRYNVVMIGDSGVGKTSFMKRAQSGKFSLTQPSSIGLDSCMWTVMVDGNPVVLHLWDTAGQERFRSITRQVFHRAQAFILMYDISSSQSFSAIRYWAACIQESGAENVVVLLLGNKSDCAEREVAPQQGEVLAKECNFGFMECSAATGENVIQSLESVARMLSQMSDSRREATVLHKEPEKKKGSRCC